MSTGQTKPATHSSKAASLAKDLGTQQPRVEGVEGHVVRRGEVKERVQGRGSEGGEEEEREVLQTHEYPPVKGVFTHVVDGWHLWARGLEGGTVLVAVLSSVNLTPVKVFVHVSSLSLYWSA